MKKPLLVDLVFVAAALTAVAVFIPAAVAQDSTNLSVAEAARQSRARKKSDKPVTVVTDDTLAPSPRTDPVSNSGPLEDSKTSTTPIVLTTKDSPTPEADEMRAAAAAESDKALKVLKQQLADAEKNLELAQLDMSLQQDTYFSNPDYVHDKAGRAKVEATQADVAANQKTVDDLRTKLADLEKKLKVKSTTPATRP